MNAVMISQGKGNNNFNINNNNNNNNNVGVVFSEIKLNISGECGV